MVAVSFFGVGGALGPAHREIGDADGGDVGEIVNGVVEQGDAVAEDAPENFGDDQAEGGGHGPAEDGGLERRVIVAGVAWPSSEWP